MTAPAAAIRVVIADDHVTVREGLAAILSRQPDMVVVGQASNGREAVAMFCQHRPAVTLLDLRMPLLDGIGAIVEIRREDPSARILVLTTFDTDIEIAGAIKAGAAGYLLKDAPRETLVDTLRRIHAGETCIPGELVAKLAATLTADELTTREQDVLRLVARGDSNKEIATSLSITETTVKSHLRSIFSKLRVLSRTEAIAVASRRGLVKL
jgi:two-component system NarL family response regulator